MAKKVKRTLPGFASVLSGGSFEILEEIVCNQYEEFLYLFDLLKDSCDDIKKLEYKEKEGDKLVIQVHTESSELAFGLHNRAIAVIEGICSHKCEAELSCAGSTLKIKIMKL